MNYVYILLKRNVELGNVEVAGAYDSKEKAIKAIGERLKRFKDEFAYKIDKINDTYYIVRYINDPVYVYYVNGSIIR